MPYLFWSVVQITPTFCIDSCRSKITFHTWRRKRHEPSPFVWRHAGWECEYHREPKGPVGTSEGKPVVPATIFVLADTTVVHTGLSS